MKAVPSIDPFPKEAWGKRACAIIGAYIGSAEEGRKALGPILQALPEPIFNWMSEVPFPAVQNLFDPFFPKGLQHYWKGGFVASLPDAAIENAHPRGCQGTERAVGHAPLPHRRGCPPSCEGRHLLARTQRQVVDGHRRG